MVCYCKVCGTPRSAGRVKEKIMFYCKECGKARGYPVHGSCSRGPCEVCGQVELCFDRGVYTGDAKAEQKPAAVVAAEGRLDAALAALQARVAHAITWAGQLSENETMFPKLLKEVLRLSEELTEVRLSTAHINIAAEVDATDPLVEECIELLKTNGHTIDTDDRALLFNMFARCVTYVLEKQQMRITANTRFAERARALAEATAQQYRELTGLPPSEQTTYDRMRQALETCTKEREALRDANAAAEVRDRLKSMGWAVGVHNDYRLNGEDHTFWLFTHPAGRWVKGEGRTDIEALTSVLEQI